MFTELQFLAVVAFLLWCLVSSLCGYLTSDIREAQLIWREHGPEGWNAWREVHFGLTSANRRLLEQSQTGWATFDRRACAALFDTLLYQARRPDSDALQFAVLRRPEEPADDHAAVLFVSDQLAVGSHPRN